jgi:opacity protein-like surface antigen
MPWLSQHEKIKRMINFMKIIIYIISALSMLLSFSSVALAQDKQAETLGIYVGPIYGYVIPTIKNGAIIDPTTGTSIFPDYGPSLKDGYMFGAKIGWLTPFTKRIMAVEFEYNRIVNDFDKANNILAPGLIADLQSRIQLDLFMLNILARYPNGRFHPYIGGGAGYALVKIDPIAVTYQGAPVINFGGGSTGVFTYQAMAGIDIDITKNIVLGLGYKYLVPQKIKYDSNILGVVPVTAEMDYSSHNITLSVCYLF